MASLKPVHYKIINDKSYPQLEIASHSYSACRNICRCFQVLASKISSKVRINPISPESQMLIIYQFFSGIYMLLLFLFIPMDISFLDLTYFYYLHTIVALLVDIIINLNTGFYSEGVIVTDRKKIFTRYIRYDFWLNLLTTAAALSPIKYIRVLYYLRYPQLSRLIVSIDEFFHIRLNHMITFELTKLIIMIVIMINFFGCAFHLLAVIGTNNQLETTWVTANGLSG